MVHLENLGLVHGHLMPSNILLTEQLRAKVASPRGPAHHAQLRYSAPESILAVKVKFQFFKYNYFRIPLPANRTPGPMQYVCTT